MNTRSCLLILLPLVILMIIANAFTLKVVGETQIGIPLYKSPKVDGTISAGEYPITQLEDSWGKLYAVHDGTKITFGIDLTIDCKGVDFLFNTGSLEATTISTSTLKYSINTSGAIEYYYGRFDSWVASNIGDVSFKIVNKTIGHVIELAVPLTSLTISSNSERKMGFALMIYGATVNYSWPQSASPYNPSTWGVVYSPDNWATKNDICLEAFLDKKSVIAGSNITFIAIITNRGDAPIPNYRIRIWFDGQLIEDSDGNTIGLKTPLEKTDRVRYEKKLFNVPVGDHTIMANVTGMGIYYDFDNENNVGEARFSANYAKIEISGTPGVSVSIDGENQVIPEEGIVTFYSTAGIKVIRAESVYNPVEGVRYVFVRWRNGNSVFERPELTVNVNENLALTIEYRKEYFVSLSFIDKDNSPITPSFCTCTFPNGTFYNGTLMGFWLTSGDLRITHVNYAGLNVLEEEKIYDIHAPMEISISCNVLSGTIQVVDPFSTPISGAEVSATFLNNTKRTYVTDQNGMVSMSKVAGGRVKLTVSHMGYSTSVDVDFSKEKNVTIKIPMSLNIVLIIVVVISIVTIIIVVKMFSHKIFRRESGRKPAGGEEYEFEEI